MTSIYFGDRVSLKSYASTSKGTKATVRIDLEVSDRYDLASILSQLDEIDQAQRKAAKPEKAASQSTGKKAQRQIAPPLLQLQDHRERDT